MIRVVLAEDQAMLRSALASLLSLESDIEIVAQAARARCHCDRQRQGHGPQVRRIDRTLRCDDV